MLHETHAHPETTGRTAAIRFPNRIAEVRRARVMKIAVLAALVQSSRAHVSKVEAGRRIPSALLLHDIARALGVLVDALYDRDWSWERKKNLHELSGNSATHIESDAPGAHHDARPAAPPG